MTDTHTTDVVIIGAGPVGLFAIFELGMLKIKAHVVDTLEDAGGQCAALYPEKPIFDIPGYPEIQAADLIENLKKQAAPFSPTYHLGQRVEKVERIPSPTGGGLGWGHSRALPDNAPLPTSPLRGEELSQQTVKDESQKITGSPDHRWQVITSKGTIIHCKAIIIAAGCGAFGPNRPPLDGIEAYENKSVFYYVKRKEDFRSKKIVIAGGGDSAVDWTNALADVAEKIYVIHRRPKFRAAPENVSQMEKHVASGKVEMVIPYQLHALKGANGMLDGVEVATLEGDVKTLDANVLLPFFGLAMELGPIAEWGLNLHMNHIEVDSATMQTNIPGIFAVGDIANYKNKLKLILCGFSEAAMASHAIHPIVHPDTALHFEYSTSKGVPA